LRALASDVRGRLHGRAGVVALFGEVDGAVPFVVALTDAAISTGLDAGALVRGFAPLIGGRGGGRAELAQGSGTNPAAVDRAIADLRGRVADAPR
jgi:alanyl-tRNA synthetase